MSNEPITTTEWTESINRWVKGNQQAAQFIMDVGDVMHLWDDLIDKDKVPADKYINDRFYKALIRIPRNPFYRDNFLQLSVVMEQAIISWFVATNLERAPSKTEHEELAAFITRSDYINLAITCAAIVGGIDWAVQVGHEARRLVHDEGLAGYREALRLEETARGA